MNVVRVVTVAIIVISIVTVDLAIIVIITINITGAVCRITVIAIIVIVWNIQVVLTPFAN